MNNKAKEALGSASYLTYHWRQYSFEQLEKEMVRVCGLCDKALGIPQDDSVTDFERGQWSVIQNVIGYVKDYSLAAELCREAGIGYKKIKVLQKDCGYSYKEEVNDFLKESRNCGTDLKLEEQNMSWLAVDKGGCEHIFAEKPCRNESNTLWICSVVYLYGQRYANTGCCYLPKGSIEKLIERELTWKDEPVELK